LGWSAARIRTLELAARGTRARARHVRSGVCGLSANRFWARGRRQAVVASGAARHHPDRQYLLATPALRGRDRVGGTGAVAVGCGGLLGRSTASRRKRGDGNVTASTMSDSALLPDQAPPSRRLAENV